MVTDFYAACADAQSFLSGFTDEFLSDVVLRAGESTSFHMTLRKSDGVEAVVALEGVRCLSGGDFHALGGMALIGDIHVTHLPADGAEWPAEAAALMRTFEGLPPLVWLRLAGPLELDVIASIITVYASIPSSAP
ncbi:hypothetical protein ACFQ7N_07240 [Streptomyces niveus]|uniref:hypothetical protein n=1 Tax=Streptomyces niveus TaxID=193462 RepID=UPI00368B762C